MLCLLSSLYSPVTSRPPQKFASERTLWGPWPCLWLTPSTQCYGFESTVEGNVQSHFPMPLPGDQRLSSPPGEAADGPQGCVGVFQSYTFSDSDVFNFIVFI